MEKKLRLRVYSDEEIEVINSDLDNWQDDFDVAENIEDMINKEEKKKEKIIEAIKERKNITLQDLAKTTNLEISVVEWFIDELIEDGSIESETHFHTK